MTPIISVIIPTFHRPDGAKAAVQSLFAQKNAPEFEIILIDNDAEASAREVAKELAKEAESKNINFIYQIEPRPGVANARNTSLKFAKGEFVAFLDDDEVAFEDWLFKLYQAHMEIGAEVIFGPIEARFNEGCDKPISYYSDFFSRKFDGETRIIEQPWGCGNTLMHRLKVLSGEAPFNIDTNETGGEDDLLWRDVIANNYKFGWAKDAWVYEDVPKSRANLKYTTMRAFAYGHNTTSQCFDKRNPRYLTGLYRMAFGAVQAVALGGLAAVLWMIGHEKRAWAYDKALRGLGKVFWGGPFRVRIYGTASEYLKKKK
ncbi:glycosyltransferase family 2 protein [Pseudaquidulcibacter saccharophilus]|uniref:glycosyltransferase family 2 protein n=1 Tax=Pseudaquidulcibacter saccharophilus TaxID=2831900 RepID=UPI001EFF5619|nr:glycosyltransferase family 2 protein [Pseudaquidulcibacter saccharophilus]